MSSTHHARFTTSSSSPTPMAVDGTAPTARPFLFRDGFKSLKMEVPRPRSMPNADESTGRPTRTPVDSSSSPLPNVFADSDTNSSPVAHNTPLNGHFLAGFADIEMERVNEGDERYTLREGPWRAPAAPVAHGVRRSREASSSPSARPMAKRVRGADTVKPEDDSLPPIRRPTFPIQQRKNLKGRASLKTASKNLGSGPRFDAELTRAMHFEPSSLTEASSVLTATLSPFERDLLAWVDQREKQDTTAFGVSLGHGGAFKTNSLQNAAKIFCAVIACGKAKQGRIGRRQRTLIAVEDETHVDWDDNFKDHPTLSVLRNVEEYLTLAEIDDFDVIITTPKFASQWPALADVIWDRVITEGGLYVGSRRRADHVHALGALRVKARWAVVPSTMPMATVHWPTMLEGLKIASDPHHGTGSKREWKDRVAVIAREVCR